MILSLNVSKAETKRTMLKISPAIILRSQGNHPSESDEQDMVLITRRTPDRDDKYISRVLDKNYVLVFIPDS